MLGQRSCRGMGGREGNAVMNRAPSNKMSHPVPPLLLRRSLRVNFLQRTFPVQTSVPDGFLSLRAPRLLNTTAPMSLGALSESRVSGVSRRAAALDPVSVLPL